MRKRFGKYGNITTICIEFDRFGDPYALLFYKSTNDAVEAMKAIEENPVKLELHGEDMVVRFEASKKRRGARKHKKRKGKRRNKEKN